MLTRACRTVAIVLAMLLGIGHAAAEQKLKVVASFSILGDLVKNVGGDRVEVTTLVGPNGDVHVYSPTPADAKVLSVAKVVFVNGLGLEGWMTRLVEASGSKAAIVVVSKGIEPRNMANEDHGGGMVTDPHAWQSIANAKLYVANIRDGLSSVDPAGKDVYDANAKSYLAELDALATEVKEAIARFPPIAAGSSPRMTPSATSATPTAWNSYRRRAFRPSPRRRPRMSPRS